MACTLSVSHISEGAAQAGEQTKQAHREKPAGAVKIAETFISPPFRSQSRKYRNGLSSSKDTKGF
jgi:hypothetical protein